eukprot:scaffold2.g7423.t1
MLQTALSTSQALPVAASASAQRAQASGHAPLRAPLSAAGRPACPPRSGVCSAAQREVAAAAAAVEAPAVAQAVDWEALAADLDQKSPLEIIDHALAAFGSDVAIAFSGAEDVALIEYAHLTGRPFRVLDTGRLNPETYRLFDTVREKGLFSFYEDGHGECCRVRKVRPLRRQLAGLRAWITGQRKDQSPGTRQAVPVVQADPVFEGVEGGPGSLIKYNPLSNVTSQEVWNFLRVMAVPINELHACGYTSIGCEPCTRPVLPNQHEREGRWWWEDATAKECGLHSGNIILSGAEQAAQEAQQQRDLWEDPGVEKLSSAQLGALLDGPRDRDTLAVLYAPWCQYCQAMEGSYAELAGELAGSHVRVARFQADVEREFAATKFGLKTFPTIVFLPKAAKQGDFIKYPSERRDAETLGLWVATLASRD